MTSWLSWNQPCAVILLLCACCVHADQLFVSGNLILINPLQSSVIFISIIVSSVALEYLVGQIDNIHNKYLRVTLSLFMEEVMVFGLVEVCLLTINYSATNLSASLNQQINIIALLLVFMTVLYGIVNTALAIHLQSRGRAWRNFEWGRLDADPQHSTVQALFKHGRGLFIIQLRSLMGQNQTIRQFPAVAFASFLARVERKYIRVIFDITFVSWGGLGLAILLNLCRSLLVGPDALILEVQTFILVFGYGTAIVAATVAFVVSRRLRTYLNAALLANVDSGTALVERRPAYSVLAFGSFEATLQLYKLFHLIFLWYMAMYIVVEAKLSYEGHGWYCVLVALEALIPVVFFYGRFATSVFVPLIAVGLGKHVDENALADLKRGMNVEESSSEESEVDEEERIEKAAMSSVRMAVGPVGSDGKPLVQRPSTDARSGGRGGITPAPITARQTIDDDERLPCLDELDDNFGTFHDGVPEDQIPPGDPTRLLGVPPTAAMEKRRWALKPLEPVFL